MAQILCFLVTLVTKAIAPACQNAPMNSRSILVIIAAILVPGGVLLLAPLIYRWIRQRKSLGATVP